MKEKRKKIAFILLALLAVLFEAMIVMIPNGGNITVETRYGMTSFNCRGVLQALLSLVCICTVCIDNVKGLIFTIIMLLGSASGMVMSAYQRKSLEGLPGALTLVLSIVSAAIICKQFRKIENDSITDVVTGILNRRGFIEKLDGLVRHNDKFYLMFVRVKNLKSINDNLGYEYGDKAIRMISDRIIDTAGENAIVSKIDGTEFAIYIPGDSDISHKANKILRSIYDSVDLSFEGVSASFYFNAYAGVACYPDDATDSLTLMKYADMAMYRASKLEEGKILFFNKQLEEELLRRTEVERCIKESLKNDYFTLVYQPQFSAIDKKLRGFETLIRMKLPNGVSISPGEFISVAEKTDLIFEIDNYVLNRALTEFKDYVHTPQGDITLSVNVSAKDISAPDFPDKLEKVLTKTGFPATCLEIEITEYSLYDSLNQTVANINKIKEKGVKLALDDFGTGYTALAQLLKLPFDLLKIDKSLIDNIERSELSRDFVSLVIYMGHVMNSEVISEGVESESQLELLKNQECDFIQGYVWSRPISFEDAKEMCS